MKQVIFIRHAKSSWNSNHLTDFERPLNRRGLKAAPFMAKKLQERGISPDLIIASPANRTLTTAQFFAEAFGLDSTRLITQPSLYLGSVEAIQQTLQTLDNTYQCVLLVGHNPTMTQLANVLIGEWAIENVPTCGAVGFRANVANWRLWHAETATFEFFDFPKNHSDWQPPAE